jgi:hypothetical protein
VNIRVSGADLAARQSVLTAIEAAELRFIERERQATERGLHFEAAMCHRYVIWCHRAWEAEYRNPEPEAH